MAATLNRWSSILLAEKPRFTASENDTTATAKSERGYTMSVSFWMAKPPELSLFSIHCSKPHDRQHLKHSNFSILPRVVGADGPFVLLRAAFYPCSGRLEYFLYKAGDPPSLERIPSPDESDDLPVRELGILGLGAGDHYLLADLGDAPDGDAPDSDNGYQLRIYSSRTKSWITRTLRNPCPGVDRVIPDKVIRLQGGSLGWVDLSHGLLVCDLLLLQDQDLPVPGAVSFIPLPEPLPGNRYKLKYPTSPTQKKKKHPSADKPSDSASWFRDLACINGVLKFVEMENPAPPENKNTISYDIDLIRSLKYKAIDGNSKKQLLSFKNVWRAVTWTRKVSSSSKSWRQTSSPCFAEIMGTSPYSAFPIISPDDDGDENILYVKSVELPSLPNGLVSALDIGNMAVKAIGRYYLPDDYDLSYDREPPFRACTLSRHLKITSANHVFKYYKITTEDSSSGNHPSETSIHVGSCEPSTPSQRLSELVGKIKRPRNAAEGFKQNDHISQVHPSENNLPQQHKWDAPPGNSLWPHPNNLAPQPCFNYCNVASYHGCLQQLSAPNPFAYGAHTSYGNYQQQWQQLPPTVELPIAVQRQPTPLE